MKDGLVTVTLIVEHPDLPEPLNAAVEVKSGELTQSILVGIASALWPEIDKRLPKAAIITSLAPSAPILPPKPKLKI